MTEKPLVNNQNRFRLKEPFCSVSHWLGAILSIAALVTLLIAAHGRPRSVVAFAIYGATLILLYSASALYHSLVVNPKYTSWLQRFDHVAIYLLIVGTYTPVCLVALYSALGWTILGIEYGLAAIGILARLFWKGAPDWLRIALYIAMGWIIVLAFPPLHAVLPPVAVGLITAGGLTYTIGTVILASDWPHLWPGKFSAHDLWHLFVLAGSTCHFILMIRYIAPMTV